MKKYLGVALVAMTSQVLLSENNEAVAFQILEEVNKNLISEEILGKVENLTGRLESVKEEFLIVQGKKSAMDSETMSSFVKRKVIDHDIPVGSAVLNDVAFGSYQEQNQFLDTAFKGISEVKKRFTERQATRYLSRNQASGGWMTKGDERFFSPSNHDTIDGMGLYRGYSPESTFLEYVPLTVDCSNTLHTHVEDKTPVPASNINDGYCKRVAEDSSKDLVLSQKDFIIRNCFSTREGAAIFSKSVLIDEGADVAFIDNSVDLGNGYVDGGVTRYSDHTANCNTCARPWYNGAAIRTNTGTISIKGTAYFIGNKEENDCGGAIQGREVDISGNAYFLRNQAWCMDGAVVATDLVKITGQSYFIGNNIGRYGRKSNGNNKGLSIDCSGNIVLGNESYGPFVKNYPIDPWDPMTFDADILMYQNTFTNDNDTHATCQTHSSHIGDSTDLWIINYSQVKNERIVPLNFTFQGNGITAIYGGVGSHVFGTDGVSHKAGTVLSTSDIIKNGQGVLILNKLWNMKSNSYSPSASVTFDPDTGKYTGTPRTNPKVFMNIDVNSGTLVLLGNYTDITKYGVSSSNFVNRLGDTVTSGNVASSPLIRLGTNAKVVFWGSEDGTAFKAGTYNESNFNNWVKAIMGLESGKDDSRLFFNAWPF